MPTTSPTPKKKDEAELQTMDFYQALRLVVEKNGYATRMEWNNPNNFIAMDGGYLCVHNDDNKFHHLLLRDVDITGTDWVFIGDIITAEETPIQ